MQNHKVLSETKIFDPRDPATGSAGDELLDSSVVRREQRWWMFLAGQSHAQGAPDIFSASLPESVPLSANGWQLTRDTAKELVPVAGRSLSASWDANGGRHCPSYVRGFDPHRNAWVERIYYAGGAENVWGPYTIGYLEWDGAAWIDQSAPVFQGVEDWERGSVYEPNLIYHDGKWKMWYVAGANQEDYLVHGYAESDDGRSWGTRTIFASAEMKLFDFCVRQRGDRFDAVFSRVFVGQGTPALETGLWWCHCDKPSGKLSDWSKPTFVLPMEDRGWRVGPWKPSFQFDERNPDRAFVFFDGMYRTADPGPFPFAFTLGCLEIDLPRG